MTKNTKWRWVALAGAVTILTWIALAAGVVMDVDTPTMLVLATLAAFSTEGTVWLAALTLGVSTFQARRELWRRLRQRLSPG